MISINLKTYHYTVMYAQLLFRIKRMEEQHHKEMEIMKEKLLEEKENVKKMEDEFGVTQRRRWETRKRMWWLTWLSNNDTDAYEYLMKIIHKTLLFENSHSQLGTTCSGKHGWIVNTKRQLKNVHNWGKRYYDEDVNIYGMKLNSHNYWWRAGGEVIVLGVCKANNNAKGGGGPNGLWKDAKRQTKDYLKSCCNENEIKFKKSWSKKRFINLLLRHNTGD